MCEFCIKHGEGQRWYLNMRNYSKELSSQLGSADYMEKFISRFQQDVSLGIRAMETFAHWNWSRRIAYLIATESVKRKHFGQIVPVEELEQVVDFVDSIVALTCPCRKMTTGKDERKCLGLGVDVLSILGTYPMYGFKSLSREEAKANLRQWDEDGLVHSVWTFQTPYIGAICNCDHNCLAYRLQVQKGLLQIFFQGEYVACVNPEACRGCGTCESRCMFGAVKVDSGKAMVNPDTCCGCGVCRVSCPESAICLIDRPSVAVGSEVTNARVSNHNHQRHSVVR